MVTSIELIRFHTKNRPKENQKLPYKNHLLLCTYYSLYDELIRGFIIFACIDIAILISFRIESLTKEWFYTFNIGTAT